MTLPTGDADQTIIWKLVVQMQQAQTDIETFKKQVTELKTLIRQTADETGSSFRVAAEVIEQQLDAASKSAKKSLAETRADLKRLQSELKALPKPTSAVGDTAAVTRTAKQDEIKVKEAEILTIKQRIAETTAILNSFRQQSTLALSELNREARNAAAGVATIAPSAQQTGEAISSAFQNDTAKAEQLRTSIEQLKQKIVEAKSDLDRLKTTGIGGEMTVDLKEDELKTYESELQKLEAEFGRLTNAGQTAFQGVATSTQQATQVTQTYFQQLGTMSFDQKIDSLKSKLLETQQTTGQSLRQISANFKQTFRTEASQTIDEFKSKIQSANAELKVLQATIANPPTNVGASQIAVMQQRVITLTNQLPQLKSGLNQVQQAFQSTNAALSQATQQVSQASSGINFFGTRINGLGDIAKLVFVGLFGGTILSILARFGMALRELSEDGYKFAQSIFQLEIGMRALRRAGIDMTTEDILDNLTRINEETGNLFSRLELISGASAFVNLIRDLGLTEQQIRSLQETIVTLAIVNGRSMEDVQRTVALAISSGYTEGLQRLGVSINRLTIAEEANRIGFEGGYTALTEYQRAQATFNLLEQRSKLYADDLSEAQYRLFGGIQATRAEIENTKTAIGEALLPVQLLWQKSLLGLIKLLANLPFISVIRTISTLVQIIKALPSVIDSANKKFEMMAERIKYIWQFILGVGKAFKDLKSINEVFAEFSGFGNEDVDLGEKKFNENADKIMNNLDALGVNLEDLEQEIADKRKKINEDLQKDLQKIEADGIKDRSKLINDYYDDVDKINQDAADDAIDLATKLKQSLADIDTKLNFDISEAKLKNKFDVDEVQRKFLEDVADAQQEYRQKELERERKFQEELLRLREDYLMELEEALENRDARAVLRARRQYNLDKERAIRANELEKLEGKEGLQNELRDLAQRRDARLRELEFELEQRIATLQRQAQFEREERQREYERDFKDLQIKLHRELQERWNDYQKRKQQQEAEEALARTERLAKWEEEKKELQQFLDDKLAIIVQSLKDQAIALGIGSEEMKRIIEAYFGEGGLALTIMEAYADAIEETVARLKRLQAGFASSFSGVDASKFFLPGKTTKPSGATGFASGGAVIARKPTEVTFGEVPELAIFAPLNQLDKLPKLLGGATEGTAGGNQNGNLGIRISLTPGLEAEIIEQSMDKIANIMFEVQRQ